MSKQTPTLRRINLSSKQLMTMVFGALLTACSTDYKVIAEFPAPLVDRIPVHAELDLSEEFSTYQFVEQSEQRSDMSLEIGPAQVNLFRTLVDGMFIPPPPDEANTYGIVISPSNLDFQYSIPRETQANIYEVWLKYRVQIYSTEQQKIADWVLSGYGKTPTAMLKSREAALDSATTQALRDVGGQIALGFASQPAISLWLNQTQPAATTLGGVE